jgi:hypothetical protein
MNYVIDASAMVAFLYDEVGASTGDHHEFDPLVPLGLCSIRFFR